MRTKAAKAMYLLLVSPIIPLAFLCWLGEKLEGSRMLTQWEAGARRLTKKVTGV